MERDKQKICAVCEKSVSQNDEADHLRSNHLGPHYFRLNGRPYRTMHPSMRCADLLRVLDLPMHAYLWETRDGKEINYMHECAIDLTHKPQLFLHIHAKPRTLQDGRRAVEEMSMDSSCV